ncbi:NifU family protein [Mycobacterium sp. pUA109]|uniref:NifU family protein n=1 Tax=Mycobacterium sp. pUA109 TaxID=3238982 RepID=UPI00351B233A
MIPMHAVATGDPQRLRWVIPAEHLPAAGTVRRAPGRLGALLDGAVIEELVVGRAEVAITLGAGHSWRVRGDEVRAALGDALGTPAGWRVEASERAGDLARVAAQLLAGPIGALAASHGGSIELVAVDGDEVRVRMTGACHGCPAAGSTLYDRLQRDLRREFGDAVTVCAETPSTAGSLGKKLLTLITR